MTSYVLYTIAIRIIYCLKNDKNVGSNFQRKEKTKRIHLILEFNARKIRNSTKMCPFAAV